MESWREELYHHGIKGQRWGVRRFQNEDGSLTKEGKERYSEVNELTRKEKRIQKYQEEYQKQGMTEDQAKTAAIKREQVEKALKIIAGVTVTAAVAYGATKYVQNNFDTIIKPDTLLSRVSTSDTASVQDAFYAVLAKDKSDISKYAGIYADQIAKGGYGNDYGTSVYQKSIKALNDIKVASPKNAQKVFENLMNEDKSFKDDVDLLTGGWFGKMSKKQKYEMFNRQLAGIAGENTAEKFYKALSDKGYNAIQDVNDQKYSGFNTNKPIIVFNAQSKIAVDSVRKLSDSEIHSNKVRAYADIGKKIATKSLVKYGSGITAITALSAVNKNSRERQVVSDYMKEHPNSKLSYDEIVNNYYKGGGS